jgi:glycosyltransferase involved in cell wall biosynthesis
MSISVCMASYNGENFIEKQIESILLELSPSDELIIVDDCSSDRTLEKINAFNDSRIQLLQNTINAGEIYSFSKAISLAKNQYIFLSDQDDIWKRGRVKLMIDSLEKSNSLLITSNFSWINNDDLPIDISFDGVSSRTSNKNLKNILDIFIGKTNYFGCAMLFKRELISVICPIPRFVESHDLWIAFISNILKSNVHIEDHTFFKRKHNTNVTSTVSDRPFIKKLFSRIIFLLSILFIYKRVYFNKLIKIN